MSVKLLNTVPVHLVGINHTCAPIQLRERLYFSDDRCRQLLSAIAVSGTITEAVILSTCNRTELYGVTRAPENLGLLLADTSQVPFSELSLHLYAKSNAAAMRHLFSVAAGLDSMVLGEQQIQGQVKHAYSIASRMKKTGPLLNRLFHQCFRAGKRSRAETKIGEGSVSMAACSVDLLRQVAPDFPDIRVLVVGAGATARIIAQELQAARAAHVTIINRTDSRAEGLARECRFAAQPFNRLPALLEHSDAIICATSSPAALITAEMVAAAKRCTPLCCIDIAMPRNIAPDAADGASAILYDLDALQKRIGDTLRQRRSEVPAVRAIIEQELAQFGLWCKRSAASPAIRSLQDHFEQIRLRELDRYRKYFDKKDWETADRFSRSLFKKVLHQPLTRLSRCGGGTDSCGGCTIQEIFGFDQE